MNSRHTLLALVLTAVVLTGGCGGSDSDAELGAPETPDPATERPTPEPVDPGPIRVSESGYTYNHEAIVPPQCYTRTEGRYNPCYTCHQTHRDWERPNYMEDGFLQGDYNFSVVAMTNHWSNLFEDRSAEVGAIADEAILAYINQDNYSTLITGLKQMGDWQGPIPEIEDLALGADAFDGQGFARDGSHWVAFNYKPLPSTFWPTNGSTDDVMVRLPEAFRTRGCGGGGYSRDIYLTNLALLEASFKELESIDVPAVDEQEVCVDLDGDGILGTTERVRARSHYVGAAADTAVADRLYPEGTEFLHTVRYIDVDAAGNIFPAPRMKEVRYMRKIRFYDKPRLRSLYGNEHQEKLDGMLPQYVSAGDYGYDNGFGWQVLGFIEAAEGHLRVQSEEEHYFCMGCHTSIGATLDHTFAFPRKVTGAAGWGYIDLRGMADVPTLGREDGEFLEYLSRVKGGDEFRQNDEMMARWFDAAGNVDAQKVEAADVYELITPSRERALMLNKAYRVIVEDQDFIRGRDATVTPATNVYQQVDVNVPPLDPQYHHDGEIRLDW